jgi:mannose-6-phosphate isomerase-like protein (cupin superfamily)
MTRPTQPYFTKNIETDTLANENFRKVIWTGEYMQLVLMSLQPGEDISFEVHPHVDQFFRVEEGQGTAVVDDVEYALAEDSVLIVHAGAEHNITNTGEIPLKLYTIYTPPNHIDGRIHPTKDDAIADHEDEEFGHHE